MLRNLTLLSVFFMALISCEKEGKRQVTLQEDVAFLANDSLQGRETGTPYEKEAARYLEERMKNIGLAPKGSAGTYFRTFSFKPKLTHTPKCNLWMVIAP
ncbi:hypothetical protein [Maribacter litopenaei]|uniref:hypothetical protein n=1 Tax=Maribacter litopenaei TaxID=2976127 RepID=UPI00308429C1